MATLRNGRQCGNFGWLRVSCVFLGTRGFINCEAVLPTSSEHFSHGTKSLPDPVETRIPGEVPGSAPSCAAGSPMPLPGIRDDAVLGACAWRHAGDDRGGR